MLDLPQAQALLTRTRPVHHRQGYPASVRAEVVPLLRRLRTQGLSTSRIARDLGIHGSTVRDWIESAGCEGATFVPVVVGPPEAATGAPSVPRPEVALTSAVVLPPAVPPRLVLVSPGGFRLEGLDLDSALALLTRLS